MHSRIFEISTCPVEKSDRYNADKVPKWFVSNIADYVIDINENFRITELEWLTDILGSAAERNGNKLLLKENAGEIFLKRQHETFVNYALKLSATTMEQFCGKENFGNLIRDMFIFNEAFEDKYGFYVYDRQADELVTIGTWIRHADTDAKYYIGGIVNYHY